MSEAVLPSVNGDAVVLIESISTAIAATFVVLRCVARFVLSKSYGVDDYFIIASVATTIPLSILVWQNRENGAGRPSSELSEPQQEKFLKVFFAQIVLYGINILTTKVSIMTLFLRFLVEQAHRRFIYALIVVQFVYTFGTSLAALLFCTPIRAFWDRSIPGGHCGDYRIVWYLNAAFDTTTAIILCVFPSIIIGRMNMKRNDKLYVCIVFALGGVACVTSAMRFRAIYYNTRTPDFTIDALELNLWSGLEINIGIICACMPTLRPLAGLIRNKFDIWKTETDSSCKSLNQSTNPASCHTASKAASISVTHDRLPSFSRPPEPKSKTVTRNNWAETMDHIRGTRYTWCIE